MLWTYNLKLAVIEFARVRPLIWDKNVACSRKEREDVWTQLAEEFFIPVLEVKNKWETLRRSYYRELKECLATGIKSKWIFFDRLDVFLRSPFEEMIASGEIVSESKTILASPTTSVTKFVEALPMDHVRQNRNKLPVPNLSLVSSKSFGTNSTPEVRLAVAQNVQERKSESRVLRSELDKWKNAFLKDAPQQRKSPAEGASNPSLARKPFNADTSHNNTNSLPNNSNVCSIRTQNNMVTSTQNQDHNFQRSSRWDSMHRSDVNRYNDSSNPSVNNVSHAATEQSFLQPPAPTRPVLRTTTRRRRRPRGERNQHRNRSHSRSSVRSNESYVARHTRAKARKMSSQPNSNHSHTRFSNRQSPRNSASSSSPMTLMSVSIPRLADPSVTVSSRLMNTSVSSGATATQTDFGSLVVSPSTLAKSAASVCLPSTQITSIQSSSHLLPDTKPLTSTSLNNVRSRDLLIVSTSSLAESPVSSSTSLNDSKKLLASQICTCSSTSQETSDLFGNNEFPNPIKIEHDENEFPLPIKEDPDNSSAVLKTERKIVPQPSKVSEEDSQMSKWRNALLKLGHSRAVKPEILAVENSKTEIESRKQFLLSCVTDMVKMTDEQRRFFKAHLWSLVVTILDAK